MRIQAITNLIPQTSAQTNTKDSNVMTNFGLKLNNPIEKDTVSFKQSHKISKITKQAGRILSKEVKAIEETAVESNGITNKLAAKSKEINRPTAMAIRAKILMSAQKVEKYLSTTFGDLIADAKHPNNPIHSIGFRVKGINSIVEKTGSRELINAKEIFADMTDLIGGKITLRDSDKRTVDGILDRLIPDIKSKRIELLEIENKRPKVVKGQEEHEASKYDYASISMLKKLIEVQNSTLRKGGSKQKVSAHLTDEYTPANYCAVHLLMRIPNVPNSTFELQIMGHNMDMAKKVDDKVYKKLDGKNPADCSEEFHKLFEPLINPKFFARETEARAKELTQNAKNTFNKYRAKMFLFQREKPDMSYSKKTARRKEQFLPIKYQLFPSDIELKYGISSLDYDYNNIAKIIEREERKANKK